MDLATGRSVGQIARNNVFTVFNGILATLFVIILSTGRWQNALFGAAIIANSLSTARRSSVRLALTS